MNLITQNISTEFPKRPPNDDEYINEADGLIYCAKCNTPRQCIIRHNDKIYLPPILCSCQREAEEKEEADFQRRQTAFHIERLKASGLQDRYLHDYTFSNDKGYNPTEIKKARRYVTEWGKMKQDCIGLLLWGDVGTGKTFIAACIANALIEKNVPVLMTSFSKILNQLSSMFIGDRNSFIDSFNNYGLLIIDDLGIERNSEFALEQIFNIIDCRYRSKKPLIITTNLTLDELKHPKDLAHSRIYDRVLERCVPLKVNNQNIRQLNANTNLQSARELLTNERNDDI